jgi:hypothetical protein
MVGFFAAGGSVVRKQVCNYVHMYRPYLITSGFSICFSHGSSLPVFALNGSGQFQHPTGIAVSVASGAAVAAETQPAAAAFSAAAAATAAVGAATRATESGTPLAAAKLTRPPIVFHAPGSVGGSGGAGGAMAGLPMVVAVTDKGAIFGTNVNLVSVFHNVMQI